MSKTKAKELGLVPTLRFVDSEVSRVNPKVLGIGPVPAAEHALERQGWSVSDLDWTAFNEAFSSQVLASIDLLSLQEVKVNPYGGALAEGHPYGASGANLIARLVTIQKYHPGNKLMAAIGIGGGMGIASLFGSVT